MKKERKILVIDGAPLDLALAKQILMKEYDVLIASTLALGVNMLNMHEPHVVLLDFQLCDTSEELLKACVAKNTPVIVAGARDKSAEIKALNLGAVDYVEKPYDDVLLLKHTQVHSDLFLRMNEMRVVLRRQSLLMQDIDVFMYNFGGKRILVAEDVQINRMIISGIVEENNIIVDFAENGEDAVQKYTDHGNDYALILMDIHMPVMSGVEAAKAIRRAEAGSVRRIPIIAMTANTAPEDYEEYRRAGMDSCLEKPVDSSELLKALIEYSSL